MKDCTASRRVESGCCAAHLAMHSAGTGGGRRPSASSSSLLQALMTFSCRMAKNSRRRAIQHGQSVGGQQDTSTHNFLDRLILVCYWQLVVQDVLELFGSWAQPSWGAVGLEHARRWRMRRCCLWAVNAVPGQTLRLLASKNINRIEWEHNPEQLSLNVLAVADSSHRGLLALPTLIMERGASIRGFPRTIDASASHPPHSRSQHKRSAAFGSQPGCGS